MFHASDAADLGRILRSYDDCFAVETDEGDEATFYFVHDWERVSDDREHGGRPYWHCDALCIGVVLEPLEPGEPRLVMSRREAGRYFAPGVIEQMEDQASACAMEDGR